MTSFQRWQCIDYYSSRRVIKYVLYNILWHVSLEDYHSAYDYWLQMCILQSMNEM